MLEITEPSVEVMSHSVHLPQWSMLRQAGIVNLLVFRRFHDRPSRKILRLENQFSDNDAAPRPCHSDVVDRFVLLFELETKLKSSVSVIFECSVHFVCQVVRTTLNIGWHSHQVGPQVVFYNFVLAELKRNNGKIFSV